MKNLLPIPLFSLLLLGLLSSLQAQTEPTPLGSWSAAKTYKQKDGLFVKDSINKNDLEVTDLCKVVEDPDGAEGKSLEFDGEQKVAAFVKFDSAHGPNVVLTCKAKLENKSQDATLVALGAVEIRHYAARSKLALIIWYKTDTERKFVIAEAPVKADQWVSITGTVQAGKLTLKVDDKSTELQIPAEAIMDITKSKLRVGYGPNRPFFGRIASIELGTLPE